MMIWIILCVIWGILGSYTMIDDDGKMVYKTGEWQGMLKLMIVGGPCIWIVTIGIAAKIMFNNKRE
jgi:hypothetical protein